MIKKVLYFVLLIVFFSALNAQNLSELIQEVGENVLAGYTKPIVNSFGASLNSGLFHSAKSHKIGGFDLQLKAMYVPIPEDGKTYSYRVLGLWLHQNGGSYQIDSVWFNGTANTIFGDTVETIVYEGRDTFAIPPSLPEGTAFKFFPFIMPQLSVGVFDGTELLIRYVPTFTISYLNDEFGFYGIGIKQEINQLPLPFVKDLPVNIAVQGVYQNLKVGDIVTSSIVNVNLEVSKNLAIITPYVGLGWEDAQIRFKYSFSFEEPDLSNLPNTKISTINIDKTVKAENKMRLVAGFTINLGPLVLNGAYNYSKYSVISGGLGISIR